MNTKQILIDSSRLKFLIEARNDEKGRTMYYVRFGSERIRFSSMDSVIDFVNSNCDLGFVVR